jgi:hypothetical protein
MIDGIDNRLFFMDDGLLQEVVHLVSGILFLLVCVKVVQVFSLEDSGHRRQSD